MMANSFWVGLRLDPLDTLFFRDGRPFDAATRASGGLPQPQTLAGALRTALLARTGFDFGKFASERKKPNTDVATALLNCNADPKITAAHFRGPFLGLVSNENAVSPLLPMPETLNRGMQCGWSRAVPVASVPGWHDADNLLPLWRKVEPEPKAETELLTLDGLKKFLNGDEPAEADCVKRDELFGLDHRIGIEVDKDTFTSADGMLYVISLLAMQRTYEKCDVCLYAEIEIDAALSTHFANPFVMPFGGEGKYVQVSKVAAQTWPEHKPQPNSMWYLATPTFFPPKGRALPNIAGLKAAASASGVPISGWDVARNGPRATRFAVPAGAVYFVEGGCGPDDFLNLGSESDALRQEGWGFALPGTWGGLT